MGMSGVSWGLVTPLIAPHARTVTHDRAGLRGRRDLPRLATGLGDLLSTLPGPFILVGHSWGGPIVRVLAARGTHDVRALVLVDPSDENDDTLFTPAMARSMARAGPATLLLAATGRYRRAAAMGAALPPPLYGRFRDECFGWRGARSFQRELRHFLPGLARLRANPPDLATLPVTIISNGTPGSTLATAHAISAAALPGGHHVTAHGAGHTIMFDRPDVVAAEILRYLP